MRPAAAVAFAVALAVSASAGAQGVGLRVGTVGVGGDAGGWIVPGLSAPVDYRAPNFAKFISFIRFFC